MGTPEFAVPSLRALVEAGIEVVAVVTQPDRPSGRGGRPTSPPVKIAAEHLGLRILQPPTLRSADVVALLRSLNPDVIVVAAYGQILRRAVLDLPPLGCVNVHPSLLPKLRGASPIQAAIREGLSETGVSIMLMDERLDAGPVLAQTTAPIGPEDTGATLGARLADLGANLLVNTLDRLSRGDLVPRPQDDAAATYCKPLRKDDGDLDWSAAAEVLERICRAYQPWPGCHSYWDGRPVRLLSVEPRPDWIGGEAPGTVLRLSEPGSNAPLLAVATGRGALAVRELQLPGKRPLAAAEFLRGQPGFVGARLGGKPATEEVNP